MKLLSDFDGDRALRLMDIEALLSSADLGLTHRTVAG